MYAYIVNITYIMITLLNFSRTFKVVYIYYRVYPIYTIVYYKYMFINLFT